MSRRDDDRPASLEETIGKGLASRWAVFEVNDINELSVQLGPTGSPLRILKILNPEALASTLVKFRELNFTYNEEVFDKWLEDWVKTAPGAAWWQKVRNVMQDRHKKAKDLIQKKGPSLVIYDSTVDEAEIFMAAYYSLGFDVVKAALKSKLLTEAEVDENMPEAKRKAGVMLANFKHTLESSNRLDQIKYQFLGINDPNELRDKALRSLNECLEATETVYKKEFYNEDGKQKMRLIPVEKPDARTRASAIKLAKDEGLFDLDKKQKSSIEEFGLPEDRAEAMEELVKYNLRIVRSLGFTVQELYGRMMSILGSEMTVGRAGRAS